MADKGYDSNEVVEAALALGMNPVIPPRSNRKTPACMIGTYISCDIWWETPFSPEAMARVATRYAKRGDSFLAICQIRALVLWTKYFDDTL